MFSFKSIVLIAAVFAMGECSEVAVAAAPLTVPAHVGYAHAVPDNIPPYASQISVVNRALAAPFAAPVAAPLAAPFPAPFPGPDAHFARFAGPYAAAPYFTGPGPYPGLYTGAPYALPAPGVGPAAYAAPYPYAAQSLLRTPFGFAPTFVR